jgi:uncharacterized protein (TIGR03083 family)
MSSVQELIAAERRDLAAMLAGLATQSWDTPSLCAGWRVREVVAHSTMPFRYSRRRYALEMIKSRGDFTAMADRCARRDASALTPAELVAAMRDNADYSWKPPGGGFEGALTHEVVHGLDWTVPLSIGRTVPQERLRVVLRGLERPKGAAYFGVDLDGIALRADDMDWSLGSGTPLTGATQDLVLVLCGRRLPPGRLRGAHSERFTDARRNA